MEKEKTCCFSGHRPNKLPWGYNETSNDCVDMIVKLGVEIEQMRKKGVTTFLTGMAMGTDMIAAELVLDLKYAYPEEEIRLIAVVPYSGQSERWSRNYQIRYETILEQADEQIVLSPFYTKSCMHQRNRYMVDHSAHLIAVYGGENGGTKNTVEYAKRKGLDIVIIDPNHLRTKI
jgi:uncharacterized phage-like protein YoqJ